MPIFMLQTFNVKKLVVLDDTCLVMCLVFS